MKAPEDNILTTRGGVVENRHNVHAAVVDATGRLLYAVGNPSRVTLVRSTAKPAQALAILETGAFEQYDFDDGDLALMCASHNSEAKHVSRAQRMLSKIDACEEDLQCGGHASLSETVNKAWIKADFAPTAICNNCSGKHAGMLAGAKALGASIADYHLPNNAMQDQVRRVFQELCGLEADGIKWGIDGCNLPAPAFPLHYLAQIYAILAEAADAPNQNPTTRSQHLSRVFHAMIQYLELVGGEGRFCTILMDKFQGTLVGKLGADGCYAIAARASEQTRRLGADGAIGISVKIEDGNIAMLYSAVMEILQQLEIGTTAIWKGLEGFHHPKLTNTAGVVTGDVSHAFTVRVQ